ncbi:MAG: hypothetical protein ACTSVI_00990 [Promethearchaeota archaeon]
MLNSKKMKNVFTLTFIAAFFLLFPIIFALNLDPIINISILFPIIILSLISKIYFYTIRMRDSKYIPDKNISEPISIKYAN